MKKITFKISGILLAFGLMMGLALQSNATEVTFRVDMSNETVSPDSVHIAGSFQGWDPATTVMSPTFGGVYTVTVDIPEGTEIEFKYVNGNAWGMDENVPESCGVFSGGSYNRYLTVPIDPVTLSVVCFGGCLPCSANVDVTFRVDMSELAVSPLGVHVAGSFQGWDPGSTEMILDADSIYVYTTSLSPGDSYQYKFINGNSWGGVENVSGPCTVPPDNNRSITIPDNDTILQAVCFGSCIPCAVPTVAITFQVDMEYVDVSPDGVHITGTFNGWDPTADEMTLASKSGLYEITLDLAEGDYAEFKYVNGNTSSDEETIPQECSQNNNRSLTIPDLNTTLDVVCFGQCGACGGPPVDVEITFLVDMSEQTVSPDGVHIAGSFQGWDPAGTILTDAGGGIYTYTATFESGYYHEYKFVNGNTWDGAEFVPEGCAFNSNRFITIPDINSVLDTVCFSSCEACPPPPEVVITFQVDMSNETISPNGIHLAGSFNQWDPTATPMTETRAGVFTALLTLVSQDVHTYKFLNGNTLGDVEIVPESCGVPDGGLGFAREITVPGDTTILDEVCFGECGPCIPPPESLVTFQVDMANETVSPDGIHLVGSFQGWDPEITPMTDAGDGIYTLGLSLVEGVHHTFKYVNGNTFDDTEDVPSECGEDDGVGGYNRYIDVPVNDTILDLVCFGRCTECPLPVDVTFQVDMSNEELSPNGVHIAGDFQGWGPATTPMTDAGDGVFTYTTSLYVGDYHEYKFINDTSWGGAETVPAGCAANENRFLTVPDANTTLDLVCFGSCTICVPPTVEVTFQVDMSNETVSPEGVHIAGDFQGWDPDTTQMQDAGDNIYTYTAILNAGEYYEYKFINGITWADEEVVPETCNQNGNRYFFAPDINTTLDVVCFSGCGACPELVSIMFQVDMALEEVSPDGVHLVGDFQGWDAAATPMADAGTGIYSIWMLLPAGSYQTYKFINGNTFDGQETVPEECGVDDGFGGFNRFLDVPLENTMLDAVCFSACTSCTQEHNIYVPAGWSGLSSWVMPGETDIVALLNDIYPELVILQTMDAMYYPSEEINTIGTWENHSAYKIKVTQDVTLTITGLPEQNKTVQLNQGWNLITVVSENPVDVVSLFSGVSDKVIVVKGIADNNVYWLEYNINTIINLMPGKAYFVLMDEAGEVTFP